MPPSKRKYTQRKLESTTESEPPNVSSTNQFAALLVKRTKFTNDSPKPKNKKDSELDVIKEKPKLKKDFNDNSQDIKNSFKSDSLIPNRRKSSSFSSNTSRSNAVRLENSRRTTGPSYYVTEYKPDDNILIKSDDCYIIGLEKGKSFSIRGMYMIAPIFGGPIDIAGSVLHPNLGWKKYIEDMDLEKISNGSNVQSDIKELKNFINTPSFDGKFNDTLPDLYTQPAFTSCFVPLSRCPPRIETNVDVKNVNIDSFTESVFTRKIASLIKSSKESNDIYNTITSNSNSKYIYVACIILKFPLKANAQYFGYHNDNPIRIFVEEVDNDGNRESIGEMIRYPSSWLKAKDKLHDIYSTLDHRTVVSVLGGTNMGKSTFCITLANSLLNKFKRVAYIDCDLGQSDFTTYGKVSLVVLDVPVIGPSYTQFRIPEKSHHLTLRGISDSNNYISSIVDLKQHYDKYISNGSSIYNSFQKNDQRIGDYVPLIINTCGWVTGLGQHIHSNLLNQLHVSHVVHFEDNSDEKTILRYTLNGVVHNQSNTDLRIPTNTDGFKRETFINADIKYYIESLRPKGLLLDTNSIIKIEPGEQTGAATKSSARVNRDIGLEIYFAQSLQPDLPWTLLERSETEMLVKKFRNTNHENKVPILCNSRMKAYYLLNKMVYSHPEYYAPFTNSLTSSIPPVLVPFSTIKVMLLKKDPYYETGDLLRVLNASIVVLCIDESKYELKNDNTKYNTNTPIVIQGNTLPRNSTTIGYGLIRAIDAKKGMFYITALDSIPHSILRRVNLIAKDISVHIPQSILEVGEIHSKTVQSSLPYTIKNKLMGIGSQVWRARHNLVRSWQKKD